MGDPHTIPCQDSTIGRYRETTVRLTEDRQRVAVIVPQPSGTFDAEQLALLIDALVEARRELMQGTS
ncbi:hypothetical protein Lesp02_83860 [Lentzea sp. NBRC 105346]|uniref:hypothetical protein n=1 Tax=Lentzea sp. NBRC 105346 TaxID=3032205 RepID=UPI0024A1203F|nr:hypothetical protein [Lentzea sp. NBRC 105346]GLZ36199.1 hypothetical protein Lesp02_83860 [Lentzea sp. NBRC 105346]